MIKVHSRFHLISHTISVPRLSRVQAEERVTSLGTSAWEAITQYTRVASAEMKVRFQLED